MPSYGDLGFHIRVMFNLLNRKLFELSSSSGAPESTALQGRLMGYLYKHREEDVFQRDLEEAFRIRRSSASRLLGRMEEQGLIRRESVAQDARLKKLVLTEKAVALHTAVEERIRNTEKLLSEGLSEEEVAAFLSTAAKIEQNLTRARIPPAPHQETVPRRRDVPDPITEEESL